MATYTMTTLHRYREQAVAILGLPTDRPISHHDVQRAYTIKLRNVHETAAGEALLLVQLLAFDYVDTRGWDVNTFIPDVAAETAKLEPINSLIPDIDYDPVVGQ